MLDQADQLRRLVRETVHRERANRPGGPLVVVSGGKGGVGTTTIASDLAYHLSLLGKRTVLVDANPSQPDMSPQWLKQRIQHRASRAEHGRLQIRDVDDSLVEVLSGIRTVSEALQPISERLRLLPGRWAPQAPPDLSDQAIDRLLGGLDLLGDATDVIVADVGSGMSPWVDRFWHAAGDVLLVTSPDPVAILDSYAAIKLATSGRFEGSAELESHAPSGKGRTLGDKIRLVVNRCDHRHELHEVASRLSQTCLRFLGVSLAHESAIVSADSMSQGEKDYSRSVRLLAAEVIGNLRISKSFRESPKHARGDDGGGAVADDKGNKAIMLGQAG
jgi:flagellar biosynthesis protein FlhG